MKLTTFVFVALAADLAVSRSITSRGCGKYGVKCVDKNTFTFCLWSKRLPEGYGNYFRGFQCRPGYVCQETSRYPCTPDTEENSITSDTTTDKSTAGSTTKIPDTRDSTDSLEDNVEGSRNPSSQQGDGTTKNIQSTPFTGFVDPDNSVLTTMGEITGKTTDDVIYCNTQGLKGSEIPVEESTPENIDIVTDVTTTTDLIKTVSTNTFTHNSKKEHGRKEIFTEFKDILAAPRCSGEELLPAPNCHQYYQCESWFLFWYQPTLKTCPEGESFSISESRCTNESDCNVD